MLLVHHIAYGMPEPVYCRKCPHFESSLLTLRKTPFFPMSERQRTKGICESNTIQTPIAISSQRNSYFFWREIIRIEPARVVPARFSCVSIVKPGAIIVWASLTRLGCLGRSFQRFRGEQC